MTGEERLAAVVTALEGVGVSCLVMGGHAVRFYGFNRNTDDFDLHISTDVWSDLSERLGRSGLFPDGGPVEGDSWRKGAFRRFKLGRLPSGKDELLEFWCENHLLAPREHLLARSVRGPYGGREIAFLGLADLIRSKETERDKDWADVTILERSQDERNLARLGRGETDRATALAVLRSRAGFEAFVQGGLLDDPAAVRVALSRTDVPMTQAYLLPLVPDVELRPAVAPIEPILIEHLRTTLPNSAKHHSIVEVVRRRYVESRKAEDRRDKEAIRARAVI
jgi:hypothetical protein